MSQDSIQDIQDLEQIIINKTAAMTQMTKSPAALILEELVLSKGTYSKTDIVYPKYDKKECYYQEFWKTYLLNEMLINHIKDCSVFNAGFGKIINELDELQGEWGRITSSKIKTRVRRTADKIEKSFECPFHHCRKNYGSDVSLNLHLKIKHNCGTKSEREALAKEICLAEEKGQRVQTKLEFPPGYLEEFRRLFKLGVGRGKFKEE